MAYDHDRESSPEKQQFYFDGAEDGYQYAVDKACEFIKAKSFGDWIEQDTESFIEDFKQAMEQ